MSARPVAGGLRYGVAGEPGAWSYVGQATYDDGHGVAEHDWWLMRSDAGEVIAVDPAEITGTWPAADPGHGVFTLGTGVIAG
jgi:hypothetical protein